MEHVAMTALAADMATLFGVSVVAVCKMARSLYKATQKIDLSDGSDDGKKKVEKFLKKLNSKWVHVLWGNYKYIPEDVDSEYFKKIINAIGCEKSVVEVHDLCSKYMNQKCVFDEKVVSSNEYKKVKQACISDKNKGERFIYKSDEKLRIHLEIFIKLVTYVAFSPKETDINILSKLQILEGLIRKEDVNTLVKENMDSIFEMIDNWSNDFFNEEIKSSNGSVQVLCMALIIICKRDVQLVLSAVYKNENIDCSRCKFTDFREFVCRNERGVIYKRVFAAINDFKGRGIIQYDRSFINDIVTLLMVITVIKEKSITSRITKIESVSSHIRQYNALFYSNNLIDLDVYLSLALPKSIDIENIKNYFLKIENLPESGIGRTVFKEQKRKEGEFVRNLRVVVNALHLSDGCSEVIKATYKTEISKVVNKIDEFRYSEHKKCMFIVFYMNVDKELVSSLLGMFPELVVIHKVNDDAESVSMLEDEINYVETSMTELLNDLG